MTDIKRLGLKFYIFVPMIFQLPEGELVFPNPALAEEDGLLAIGGDLSKDRLVLAYENGIFPWFSEGDPICWFAPPERCVIFPEKVKVSKSMRKIIADQVFTITMDQAFADVIVCCAKSPRKDQDGTWITTAMQNAYINLHKYGWAHSIEVWYEGELAGGLYGLVINGVFVGESMFSLKSNASKTALIWLCQQNKYRLIDCQVPNDHLMSLGAEMIPREDYTAILQFPQV